MGSSGDHDRLERRGARKSRSISPLYTRANQGLVFAFSPSSTSRPMASGSEGIGMIASQLPDKHEDALIVLKLSDSGAWLHRGRRHTVDRHSCCRRTPDAVFGNRKY